MTVRRISKDILRLIFENIDDSQTWQQLSQINRQAYKLNKEMLFIEHTITSASPDWPYTFEEKYATKRNGEPYGLQVSIARIANSVQCADNLLKVRVYYVDAKKYDYIWYDGLKSHKMMINGKTKDIYGYAEIEYRWENRTFVVVCKLRNGTTRRHVFGLNKVIEGTEDNLKI